MIQIHQRLRLPSVFAAALLGLAIGYVLGCLLPRDQPEPNSDHITHPLSKKRGHRWRPTIDTQAITDKKGLDRIQELEAQIAMYRTLIEQYRLERDGLPLRWPAEIPEHLRPEAFEQQVQEGLKDCEHELVRFDCSEMPCVAFLRGFTSGSPGRSEQQKCPNWEGVFGRTTGYMVQRVDCPGGGRELLIFETQNIDEFLDRDNDEFVANYHHRTMRRLLDSKVDWRCKGED